MRAGAVLVAVVFAACSRSSRQPVVRPEPVAVRRAVVAPRAAEHTAPRFGTEFVPDRIVADRAGRAPTDPDFDPSRSVTVTLRYVVTIPAGTANGTTAATTLTVTGALGGAEDDASDVSTTTVQAPVLGIVKNVRNVTTGGSFDNTASAAPNQELEYRITVTNSGSSAASTLVLSDPLNANTGYKMASATFNAGTSGLTGATAAFSNTPAPGPYVYGYTPVDQGCSAPAGYDYCVTSVRWTMTGSQAGGGSSFNVNFNVRVK